MSDSFDRVQPPPLLPAESPAARDAVFNTQELDRLRNVGMAVSDIDPADLKPVRKRRRFAGPIMAVCLLMVVGAAAAGAWRGYGDKIRQFAEAQIAAKEIAPLGDQQSDSVLRNLEAMKQDLSQVAATQAQLDQRLTALEARPPQSTGNAMPPGGSGWLDDPGALAFVSGMLQHPIAPARPATVGAAGATPRPRPQAVARPLPRPVAPALTQTTPIQAAPPRTGPIPPEPVPGQ